MGIKASITIAPAVLKEDSTNLLSATVWKSRELTYPRFETSRVPYTGKPKFEKTKMKALIAIAKTTIPKSAAENRRAT